MKSRRRASSSAVPSDASGMRLSDLQAQIIYIMNKRPLDIPCYRLNAESKPLALSTKCEFSLTHKVGRKVDETGAKM